MGRRVPSPNLISHVRALRLSRGLSQQELARRVELSRQAVGAIENGQYIPSTAVALRLADVLDSRVEDLFVFAESDTGVTVDLVAPVPAGAGRLAVVNVRGRWVGHSLSGGREIQESFVPASGVHDEREEEGKARLLGPAEDAERSALLLGCDPSLGILGAHLTRHRSEGQLLWLATASQPALDAVGRGEAHLAGSHLRDPRTGEYNVPQARQALGTTGGLVVAFTRWEQGFMVAPGNPREVRTVSDLARPNLHVINREPGSGSRTLLDELLSQVGLMPEHVRGYARAATSHLAVARAVAEGVADVGIGLEAVARAYDLAFVPLATVHFDLIIPRDQLEHPTVTMLLDHLQTRALRADLRALPGYDVTVLGTVVADLPAVA
ncbi:MAG TPA: substrate-binding domain-containing protein [Chloroflexota bacterium]|nr:substrate-binding domain-containing protein [Chloroflexota bacterium]